MAQRSARAGRLVWRLIWIPCLLAIAAVLALQAWFYAHILWWRDHEPATTAFMRMRLGQLRQKDPGAKLTHQWVPYDRISKNLKRTMITTENAKFVGHENFD